MKQRFAPKTLFAILLVIALVPFLSSCGGGGGKSTPEPTLTVTTTPATGSTQPPGLGPFNLNVKITSTMPKDGVTISISAAPSGSATTYFTKTLSTKSASNDFTITGQTQGVQNMVTIQVKSNTTASNTWSGSYNYTQK